MNDALGNPIVIGNTYGYSTSSSGFGKVTICEAVKINEKSVSVKPLQIREFLYGESLNRESEIGRNTSIQSYHLFPVGS